MKFNLFLLPILSVAAFPRGPSARNAESSRLAIRAAQPATEPFVLGLTARQDDSMGSGEGSSGSSPTGGEAEEGMGGGSGSGKLLRREFVQSLVARQEGMGQGGGSGGSGGSFPPDNGAGEGQGEGGGFGRLLLRSPQTPGESCICTAYGDCSGCADTPGCACPCVQYQC